MLSDQMLQYYSHQCGLRQKEGHGVLMLPAEDVCKGTLCYRQCWVCFQGLLPLPDDQLNAP